MGVKLNRSNVYKRTTFFISGIRFTYKFVIPDIKTKQKYFFDFLKYWPSSHDFNKLVIKAKMHAKITYIYNFLFSLLYKFFLVLRDLAVCMKTKVFFCFFFKNRVFLIPDLYF